MSHSPSARAELLVKLKHIQFIGAVLHVLGLYLYHLLFVDQSAINNARYIGQTELIGQEAQQDNVSMSVDKGLIRKDAASLSSGISWRIKKDSVQWVFPYWLAPVLWILFSALTLLVGSIVKMCSSHL